MQAAIGDFQGVTFDVISCLVDQPFLYRVLVKAVSDCINDTKDVFVILVPIAYLLLIVIMQTLMHWALEESEKKSLNVAIWNSGL